MADTDADADADARGPAGKVGLAASASTGGVHMTNASALRALDRAPSLAPPAWPTATRSR